MGARRGRSGEEAVVAEQCVLPEDLVDDFLGATGEQRTVRAAQESKAYRGRSLPPAPGMLLPM
jgi:hypothetical protein